MIREGFSSGTTTVQPGDSCLFQLLVSRFIGKWPNPLHDHVHRGGVLLAMFISYPPETLDTRLRRHCAHCAHVQHLAVAVRHHTPRMTFFHNLINSSEKKRL